MKTLRLSACLALVLALVPGEAAAQPERCTREDISLRLKLNAESYEPGTAVRMKLIVRNRSETPCLMEFPNGRKATYEILEGEEVVRDDRCAAYTQEITTETWEPGHREVYKFRWGQRGNSADCAEKGQRVGPGSYSARGIFDGVFYESGSVKTRRKDFLIGD